MPRPRTHDEALRGRLLDRAGELLSQEGAGALSLRRLATDAATSTTAVYSLFGGKPGLVRELYVEAFHRLGTRLRAVAATGDPAEDLVRLGVAYRASALADPHLYAVMFGGAIPGFDPDDAAVEHSRAALAPLLGVIETGVREGVFTDTDGTMAVGCWGIVHGLVSLELLGNLPPGLDVAAAYERALRANTAGWTRPTGT
ncbi:TetR/AcrR family transcriptional regulator [Actinokineospora terrae]|uniref:Transcriptional regulator, TetR family n=1 Tax=Actinokineospora terrae TaxID=155974 RepID=A0A1H9S9R6_9PSEU|nr:TetR-like C-terminal domain-containing protein [Actinokineospora terrae]SER81732.1 transcriptional regulator, TetR family [Actinokineospora terrae]